MPITQITPSIYKQVETFTGTGQGSIISTGNNPVKNFAIQVDQTGIITAWTIRLETSIDGINFTTLLTHTLASTGASTILYSTSQSPALYFRANCFGLTIGLGTNIIVTILGSN